MKKKKKDKKNMLASITQAILNRTFNTCKDYAKFKQFNELNIHCTFMLPHMEG